MDIREDLTVDPVEPKEENSEQCAEQTEGTESVCSAIEENSLVLAESEAESDSEPGTDAVSPDDSMGCGNINHRRIKLALKLAGALLLLLCVSAAVYFNSLLDKIDYKDVKEFHQYYNLSDTDYVEHNEVYEIPLYYNESTTLEGFDLSMIDIPNEDILNIMLIGTDLRTDGYKGMGNTDSIIMLSINTRDKNVKLTSFMRDMYVEVPERGENRLNTAYSFGGPQLLFDTLKLNFNVDVDKYVRVNFSNFKRIIDQVGGLDIELTNAEAEYMNKYSYKYKTKYVESGLQHLDGAQALSYARCRKIDSDFKRTERQRKVILSFVDEVRNKNAAELNGLLNIMLPMIQTNLSKSEIVRLLADSGRYMNHEIETLNIPIKNSYKPRTIKKRSVICPNFELNSMAILAHVYSTYKLDVSGTVFQDFEAPADDDEITDEDGNVYYNDTTAATTATAPYYPSNDRTEH